MLQDQTNNHLTLPFPDFEPRGWESSGSVSFDALTQPDCILPSQYFGHRSSRPVEGEIRLLIAVLQDAINLYVRTVGRKTRPHIEQFEEVSGWFKATGVPELFAFENICEILGLEPDRMRRWLETLGANGLSASHALAADTTRRSRRGWRLNLGRPRRPRPASFGRRVRNRGDTTRDITRAPGRHVMINAHGSPNAAGSEGDPQLTSSRAGLETKNRLPA
jgi:hypothetical protein